MFHGQDKNCIVPPEYEVRRPSGTLRKGKQSSTNTVYSGGGELLTTTGDIVRRWKEYFEDLLNTPSIVEAEAGDSEVDSFITQAEVTEVVSSSVARHRGWMRSALGT